MRCRINRAFRLTDLKTLDDYLAPDLRLLSIGLNPSLPSVAAGFYFANPRNRFWKALNASRLLSAPVEPGRSAMQHLFEQEAIGFTDLVKRPTRGAVDLRAADYCAGTSLLQMVLEKHQPVCAWFHGKLAFKQFSHRVGLDLDKDAWGLQSVRIGATRIFVTPNPSPANAAYSLDDLVAWYDALADFMAVHQG
jgi:TDG/mug DNA glycosylase family protein